jgi:hypothetical protein
MKAVVKHVLNWAALAAMSGLCLILLVLGLLLLFGGGEDIPVGYRAFGVAAIVLSGLCEWANVVSFREGAQLTRAEER